MSGLVVALLSSGLGFAAGQARFVAGPVLARLGIAVPGAPAPGVTAAEWRALDAVRRAVRDNYVDPVSDQDLLTGALRGMVEATGDRYSLYLTAAEYRNYLRHFEDNFAGVGVQIEVKDNYITVVRPLQGTPGEKAGLRTGDRIVAVDGRDVTQLSLDEVVNLIRGPAGTLVRLTISRWPYREQFDVDVRRARIEIPQLEGTMLRWAPGIGYIRIEEFNTGIAARVAQKAQELRRQGMRALVLDLRQNPGGLLNEAVDVASLFVPGGPVAHVVSRTGRKETLVARGKPLGVPLAVLIDGGSASASEIVAGAVKDRGAGVLVGTRTYGKGSVQSFIDLPGGAAVKLTTARYLTAGGHMINGKGIDPDVLVPMPEGQPIARDGGRDPQVRKAVEVLMQKL